MKSKKNILIFLICLCLFSLFGCKGKVEEPETINRNYDKETVEAAAKDLIEKSIPINEILFGKGLDFEEEGGTGIYKMATEEALSKYGVSSVEDIKARAAEVYSSGYMGTVNSSDIFNSVSDEGVIRFYTRYYNAEGGGIFVNSEYSYALKNTYEYLSDPVALRSEGDVVIVSVSVKASYIGSDKNEKSRTFDKEIKLVEENGQWKLHSSSYIVYNEYTDIYENINK